VECTVPKLDVKVSGSGASRRAAEQAAAKKALDELASAAPAMTAKPKRKGARAAKLAEQEVVPGVTGVQAALDLRTPDRRERSRASNSGNSGNSNTHNDPERPATAPFAVIRASHVEPSAGTFAAAEKTERATIHRTEKSEKLDKTAPEVQAAKGETADKQAAVHAEQTVDNAVHNPVEKNAAKADSAGEKVAAKHTDKPAGKSAEAFVLDKTASPARQREDVPAAHSASIPKSEANVEAHAEASVEVHVEAHAEESAVRAADAGH
jgi:ribonuclease-3